MILRWSRCISQSILRLQENDTSICTLNSKYVLTPITASSGLGTIVLQPGDVRQTFQNETITCVVPTTRKLLYTAQKIALSTE